VKHPVIILNTLGYYDALLALLDHAVNEGFMKGSHRLLWQVADTPAQAIALLADEDPAVEFESKY
jgi:predicted Rossmann-fold nucleotide-binding protein